MTGTFHIEPLDPAGEPEISAGTWYVKEGDYVHCTCYSPDEVKLVLKYIEELHAEKKWLKDKRLAEYVSSLGESSIKVTSQLAYDAVEAIKIAQDFENLIAPLGKPKIEPGPANSEQKNKGGKNSPP